jgi:hypothetical protein
MITPVKRINRFFMLATAPFLGLILCLWLYQPPLQLDMKVGQYLPGTGPLQETAAVQGELTKAQAAAAYTIRTVSASAKLYQQTTAVMNSMVSTAKVQSARPQMIYNRRITAKLGAPSGVVNSSRISIELYRMNPGNYKGYAMKIKLKDPSAMTMRPPRRFGNHTSGRQTIRSGCRNKCRRFC